MQTLIFKITRVVIKCIYIFSMHARVILPHTFLAHSHVYEARIILSFHSERTPLAYYVD